VRIGAERTVGRGFVVGKEGFVWVVYWVAARMQGILGGDVV